MGDLEQFPQDEMQVHWHLAQFAHVTNQGLTMMGAGTMVIPPGMPFAIAGEIRVPWNETNRKHRVSIECLDRDGQPFTIPGLTDLPVHEFEVGRPPGFPAGTHIPYPVAIVHSPVDFPAESWFELRMSIDGETRRDWRLTFVTPPDVQSQANAA